MKTYDVQVINGDPRVDDRRGFGELMNRNDAWLLPELNEHDYCILKYQNQR